MAEHHRFQYRALEQLRADLQRLGLDLPLDEDVKILGEPVALGDLTVPNRFVVQPMEGFDAGPDGSPGELSLRRYRRYAEGGSGLIWFEATAVLHEARSNPGQFFIHKDNVENYRRLVAETRRAARKAFGREPVLVLQLTHSGRYSKPTGVPAPLIAHHSAVLDPIHQLGPEYPLVTDEYLDRLQDIFVAAARLAAQAGFDGVDLKSCHRYLISELLASFTREGKYGGSFENRTRMLRETLARIRAEVPNLFITTRMNAHDGIRHPYGFGMDQQDERKADLREPIALAQALRGLGARLLNITIGNPYFNPHLNRPYDFPIAGAKAPAEHPLEGIARFVTVTRAIQQAVPDVAVVGSGYTWLRSFMPYLAAALVRTGAATLIGQGRGAFAYPDSVKDILEKGRMDPARTCVACSACTQIMRDGARTGCVVRDSAVYGPEYRRGRRFALDRLRQEAQRCRECLEATCVQGCPAHVRIPVFLKAFANDDIRAAYEILRESNVLPEMCGYVCPAYEQCEHGCIERVFTGNPVPIQDIQLVTCQLARRQGLTGAALAPEATGRRVAVVGGGPAGVACTVKLLEKGHRVTLFERESHLGGTPDRMIPDARYPMAAAELEAILGPAWKAGRLEPRFNTAFGPQLTLELLRRDHDAVFLAFGLGRSISLGQAAGVVDALKFLWEVKARRLANVPEKLAVLGAGNTALDAANCAKKLGARDVYLVYRRSFTEMPGWSAERDAFLDLGGHILILTQPLGYVTDSLGRLQGLRIARTELGTPDESGRRRPVVVPNSESVLEVGLVIEALGQAIPEELKEALQPLTFTKAGQLSVRAGSCFTGVPKVYAGGDAVNGGTTVVQAVVEGMKAAEEIHQALVGAAQA